MSKDDAKPWPSGSHQQRTHSPVGQDPPLFCYIFYSRINRLHRALALLNCQHGPQADDFDHLNFSGRRFARATPDSSRTKPDRRRCAGDDAGKQPVITGLVVSCRERVAVTLEGGVQHGPVTVCQHLLCDWQQLGFFT